MKRLLLLLVLLVGATAVPVAAQAAVPCRDRIYNDWYHDGKISSAYPVACYRDALKHVTSDARVYSSLTDNIQSAMQAAIARAHGKKVPTEIGKGFPKATNAPVSNLRTTPTSTSKSSSTQPSQTTTTLALGTTSSSSGGGGGGGVPLPLLVLGGLAILLAAAGGLGMILRRRGGGPAGPAV